MNTFETIPTLDFAHYESNSNLFIFETSEQS
jgi:hypothetical protein